MLISRKKQLEAEFASEQLYERPVKGGTLTYIHHYAVIERLNRVYGHGHWSFETLEYQFFDQEVVVKGQLCVPEATYSQFGCYRTGKNSLSTGEAIKSATSNCLMRCAMMLGIGLYLRERNQIDVSEMGMAEESLLSERQNNYLLQIIKKQQLGIDEVDHYCLELYGHLREQLTKQQASQLIDDLNKGVKISQAA